MNLANPALMLQFGIELVLIVMNRYRHGERFVFCIIVWTFRFFQIRESRRISCWSEFHGLRSQVRRLEAQGLTPKQAEAITAVITEVLNDSLENVAQSFTSKTEMTRVCLPIELCPNFFASIWEFRFMLCMTSRAWFTWRNSHAFNLHTSL